MSEVCAFCKERDATGTASITIPVSLGGGGPLGEYRAERPICSPCADATIKEALRAVDEDDDPDFTYAVSERVR